jgi:hypothetical protein
MITLTYPGDWRGWVPDGSTLERHRRAFVERWRRRYGGLTGVWVKEFQVSGSPHLHTYVALPDAVSAEEFEALRRALCMDSVSSSDGVGTTGGACSHP